MDEGIGELSAEAVIRDGGWHPGYARVLLIEQAADLAVVLVDGNGDGAELEVEYWERDADGRWCGGSTSGYGPLRYMSGANRWNAGDFVAALGRVQPSAEVSFEYGGRVYRRKANEFGVWGFVHAADSVRPGDLPTVLAVTPPGD